jgi:hypothetical protein
VKIISCHSCIQEGKFYLENKNSPTITSTTTSLSPTPYRHPHLHFNLLVDFSFLSVSKYLLFAKELLEHDTTPAALNGDTEAHDPSYTSLYLMLQHDPTRGTGQAGAWPCLVTSTSIEGRI